MEIRWIPSFRLGIYDILIPLRNGISEIHPSEYSLNLNVIFIINVSRKCRVEFILKLRFATNSPVSSLWITRQLRPRFSFDKIKLFMIIVLKFYLIQVRYDKINKLALLLQIFIYKIEGMHISYNLNK